MLNRAVYQRDPTTHPLVNKGVAKVSDDTSADAGRKKRSSVPSSGRGKERPSGSLEPEPQPGS